MRTLLRAMSVIFFISACLLAFKPVHAGVYNFSGIKSNYENMYSELGPAVLFQEYGCNHTHLDEHTDLCDDYMGDDIPDFPALPFDGEIDWSSGSCYLAAGQLVYIGFDISPCLEYAGRAVLYKQLLIMFSRPPPHNTITDKSLNVMPKQYSLITYHSNHKYIPVNTLQVIKFYHFDKIEGPI